MSKQSRTRQKRQAHLPVSKSQLWNRRFLIFGGILLIAAVAAIYGFGLTRQHNSAKPVLVESPFVHKATPEEQALSWKTEFGQFPPYTDAERELEKMLHGKDEDIDLGLANWLMVADIPEFHNLTREAYLAQLDAMTEQVQQDMARMQVKRWPNADSDNPETRCQRFCSAILFLKFDYAEEFREENLTSKQMFALYANPDNIFLAGLMRTKQGSCVSMPMIYLVIGRRLGMPVHLVCIGKHFFIRWDEPRFRMDIETTIVAKTAWTTDESVYFDSEGMTRDQLRGDELRNLTSREVIGEMFHARSAYWHTTMGKYETQSCLDVVRAHYLAPDDPNIKGAYEGICNRYGIKPEYKSIEIVVKPNLQKSDP